MTAAIALAAVAWVCLLAGLVYAHFIVAPSPPNPVIVFSAKGLTGLLVELASLGIGCLGLLLTATAFLGTARRRALACAAVGNASVCIACVALLL